MVRVSLFYGNDCSAVEWPPLHVANQLPWSVAVGDRIPAMGLYHQHSLASFGSRSVVVSIGFILAMRSIRRIPINSVGVKSIALARFTGKRREAAPRKFSRTGREFPRLESPCSKLSNLGASRSLATDCLGSSELWHA